MFARTAVSMMILFCLCGHAHADVVVVDSCESYDLVTDALGIGNESFDFSTYEGSFSSVDVVTSSGSIEVSAASGLQGVLGSYLMTDTIGETLVINFEEKVQSVGGSFFLIDQFQLPVVGLLELELSDGTSFITALRSDGAFAGFISSRATIESLSLRGFGLSMFAAPAVSSLKIGVVPSPAGLALLGCAVLVRSRHRRH